MRSSAGNGFIRPKIVNSIKGKKIYFDGREYYYKIGERTMVIDLDKVA